jgi:hypothetical protein
MLPTRQVLTPATHGEETLRRCAKHRYDFRLELKLVTQRARYWLIAQCIGFPFAGWEEGKVVVESLEHYADGHDPLPYGSADLKSLQRIDYVAMLRAEIEQLLEAPWSLEIDNRIREVRAEMYKIMKVFKFWDGSIVAGDAMCPGSGKVEPGRP